ncbi:GIY-YIG nuclease family protein [Streptomyces cadmiisoli]|uniref:GIY-YIG nuclease family protein n=1 Tax=Streptomyces cadmiisoli TaxID=2184053 RepID=UPI003646F106
MTAPHPEQSELEDLYKINPAGDMPPYLKRLYPQFLRYWQYLGTGTSCRRWDDPGYAYLPAEDPDCPLNYEFKVVLPTVEPETPPDVRTALYRMRNSDGRLLYIGISANPLRRWPQHAADKPWWPDVSDLSMQWFENRSAALAAEARAIRTERPLHNVVHNESAA